MKKGDVIHSNDAEFYRRIFRGDKKYVDKKTGRPTSRAFTPRPKDDGKLSVNLKILTTVLDSCLNDTNRFSVFSIENTLIKKIGLQAVYDPLTSEEDDVENIAHTIIVGFPKDDESKAGILARSSKFII